MKRIGLIACSCSKLGESEPERFFKAQDIYTGNTFRISKTIGLKKFNCDDWYILSAKHGLLDKDKEIVYYNQRLSHGGNTEWYDEVIEKLKEKCDLQNDIFYIFGGSDYYRGLIPSLNHCFVFNYKNSNTIDLDSIKEYCSSYKVISYEKNITKAISLRNPEELNKIHSKPGYYKWWVSRNYLDFLLDALQVSFEDIEKVLEAKDDLFCVYVGIAAKESVRQRLNWHVNDPHTASRVRNGTLSTLRQTISSIVAHNQYDKAATDSFIDSMFVEWFYIDAPIKSEKAKTELHITESKLMADYLRILNIQDNHHPLSKSIKTALKKLRKESK